MRKLRIEIVIDGATGVKTWEELLATLGEVKDDIAFVASNPAFEKQLGGHTCVYKIPRTRTLVWKWETLEDDPDENMVSDTEGFFAARVRRQSTKKRAKKPASGAE